MSRFAPVPAGSRGFYIWFFRGTPLLVQIAFLYFGLGVAGIYKLPDFEIGPVHDPRQRSRPGSSPSASTRARTCRRSCGPGILSIDRGQMEAAKSLGMTYGLAMRRIVLPQAARVIVPPLGNEFNNMLKTTSLLVVISVQDIYGVFSNKNGSGSTSFHPFELFLAAAVWYLVLTTIWGFVQALDRAPARQGNGRRRAGPGLRDAAPRARSPIAGAVSLMARRRPRCRHPATSSTRSAALPAAAGRRRRRGDRRREVVRHGCTSSRACR